MALLEVRELGKAFGGVAAIADLSFAVPEGSIYAVIGPNGAGKTTLFNMLSGVYVPTPGSSRTRSPRAASRARSRTCRSSST
jgi:branched-chain amino acid transport system ATP-binding protein